MATTTNTYDPANDDNQGVMQLMAQGQEATPGVAQNDPIHRIKAQGPEPEKEEVNEEPEAVNDDVLAEEDVENKTITGVEKE